MWTTKHGDGDKLDEDGERRYVNPLVYASYVKGLDSFIGRRTPVINRFGMESSASESDFSAATMVELDPGPYIHLRAHETVLERVCRLLPAKKK